MLYARSIKPERFTFSEPKEDGGVTLPRPGRDFLHFKGHDQDRVWERCTTHTPAVEGQKI